MIILSGIITDNLITPQIIIDIFLVEKIGTFDDDFKDEWFNNHSEYKYSVKSVRG